MNVPSKRMKTIRTQYFANLTRKIAEIEADGTRVFRLDIGSPDLPPAQHIVDAIIHSVNQNDRHGYQSHRGSAALRNGWAQMYQSAYCVDLNPEKQIVPLMGSKEGIFHLTQAYIDPGDIVLIPDPAYLTYESAARFAGGEVHYLPLLRENQYLPDLKSIPKNILRQAKLLWLNYPSNPTTAIAPLDFFAEALEFAHQNNIILCHDASYTQVTFNGYKAPSVFQVDSSAEIAIEFNSLSKSHNMAGWRLGAALGNSKLLDPLFTLKTQVDSGHFLPIMDAAVAAMTGDQKWLVGRNEIYWRRTRIIMDWLDEMGLDALSPSASLYVWCKIPDAYTSESFTEALLRDAHVSVSPGTVFGKNGEGYIRICFCATESTLNEAMSTMAEWMKRCV